MFKKGFIAIMASIVALPALAQPIDQGDTFILESGIPGSLGGAEVGNMGMDKTTARLSLGWQIGKVAWNTSLIVKQDSIIPTPDRNYLAKLNTSGYGNIIFSPLDNTSSNQNLVVLVEGDGSTGGGLRLEENSTHQVSAIVENWNPALGSFNADIQWWPGDTVKGYTASAKIKTIHVNTGSLIDLGGYKFKVAKIEMKTDNHPSWIFLEPLW